MEKITARIIDPLVLMSTKIISLRLKEVCRQSAAPQTIVECECRGMSRYPYSASHSRRNNPAPSFLGLFHFIPKKPIQ
jgi:hypothetical protein